MTGLVAIAGPLAARSSGTAISPSSTISRSNGSKSKNGEPNSGVRSCPPRLISFSAAADREVVFGPNDLRAGLEAAGG
jgi:hypothetical protein